MEIDKSGKFLFHLSSPSLPQVYKDSLKEIPRLVPMLHPAELPHF